MPKGTPYIQPSQNTDQQTPRDLFDELWEEFGPFNLDPCCLPAQYTARRVLENGGEIFIPHSAFYTTRHWLEALPYAGPSQVHMDGLTQSWVGKVFMNPPYGLALRKWTAKAVHEVECGNAELVVALVPAKTDTIWWQEYVISGIEQARIQTSLPQVWYAEARRCLSEVRFIKGRLTFEGYSAPAGHASGIVVWRK